MSLFRTRRLLLQVHHLQLRIAFDPSEVRRFALLAAGSPAHVLGELTGFSDQNSWELWMIHLHVLWMFLWMFTTQNMDIFV